MPCVFPVLSIKVLSLVKHSGEPASRVRLHGLAYTAGVLAAFLSWRGCSSPSRARGAGIGWGFQLQSPLVVAGLAYLLFAMGLSLSGVVHLGGGIAGLGDGLTRRAGLEGSFFTGILATVVATPCTAPFMGSAVGFALTQAPLVSLTVFASLGLGLALPFLVLTTWPAAVRRLPRPGAWMETLKRGARLPDLRTVAWLVWVLSQQVGSAGLLAALTGLVLVGLAAWAWERARHAGGIGAGLAPPDLRCGPGGDPRADLRPRSGPGLGGYEECDGRGHHPVHPGPPRFPRGRRQAGLRQHDGRLVHHLSGQRTHGAPHAERGGRVQGA